MPKNSPNHLAERLREAAEALTSGTPRPDLAGELLKLASATEAPLGYTVRVLGGINHEYFLPSVSGAIQATKDDGYSEDEVTLVPLVPVPFRYA